eukprot:CAMPEP_0182450174 /NCGR_PEP_ID=MMETSP1172-20130603/39411_1 /TAXON_ID=708627 /ORGANISM="Timspurckia oligopyrenoides, Strain CCMP3278" /LENGTH=802 /DNA_ID=CAMNT_0024647691 /DNA_START=79 /DNA_END=2487 /DNA_ORIENTATION=-
MKGDCLKLICIFVLFSGCWIGIYGQDTVDDNLEYCRIVPYTEQKYIPPENACEGVDESLSLDIARNIGWKYAPTIYMHDLEEISLVDGAQWVKDHGEFARVKVEVNKYVVNISDSLTEELMYETVTSKNFTINANNYWWEMDPEYTGDWRSGSGYDSDNKSLAKIMLNVFEYSPRIWVFNYWMYYAYQTCSNQWSSFIDFTKGNQTLNTLFEVCDLGVHDGDLENMAVMVCKSEDASVRPLSLRYMQHGKAAVFRDCSKSGECNFVQPQAEDLEDEFHPVLYSALNTHASYDRAAINYVYASIPMAIVDSTYGVLLVDRTMKGSKRFVPTESNVVALPEFVDFDAATQPDLLWTTFGGYFGEASGNRRGVNSYRCFNNETGNEFVDCPTDQSFFNLVLNFYGFDAPSSPNLGPLPTSSFVESETAGSAPTGAYGRVFFSEWVDARNHPVYDLYRRRDPQDVFDNLCADISSGRDVPTSASPIKYSNSLFANILIFVIVSFLIGIGQLVVFGLKLQPTMTNCFPLTQLRENQKPLYSNAFQRGCYFLMTTRFVSFSVALVGLVLFLVAIPTLFDLLETYVNVTNWPAIHTITVVVISIGAFIFLIAYILQVGFVAFMLLKYRKLGFDAFSEYCRGTFADRRSLVTLRWLTSLVCAMSLWYLFFFSAALFMALFVGGVFLVFGAACDFATVVTDGVCLDFEILGVTDLICGADVVDFCNDLFRIQVSMMVWGGACLFWASVFGTWGSVSIYWQLRYWEDMVFKDESIENVDAEDNAMRTPSDDAKKVESIEHISGESTSSPNKE